MSDESSGLARRDLLEKGAVLGGALAMGAIGGAAGQTDVGESASVGAVQATVYQWSSGPDGNGYAGPNAGRSNVSPDTGDVYIGWDSGAEKLFRGDGSSWAELADFSAIGTGGGGTGDFREETYPYDGVIYFDSSASEYVYYDMGGRSGTVGEVATNANPAPLLNDAVADYDGSVDGTRGGKVLLTQMSTGFSETVFGAQGVRIEGMREALYSRDPSSAAGGEYLTHITTDGAADPLFELTDSAAPNGNAKGSGIYGIDMTGSGRGSDSTTFVEMGTAGRTTVQNCVLYNTGGDGIFANDSFSAHVIQCAIRDCGLYSEDGSGNEDGTNGIRTAVTDQNVNLAVGGTFVIQGPGAGTTNPASNIPSAIRSESGASVKVEEEGGRRSGVKVHSGAATAAGIKGEDIQLTDLVITGEGSAAAGVWMKGGRLVASGGEWEKMRDIVYMENNFTGGVSKIEGVYFDSPNADGGGEGNAIRVPSGGSGGVPALDDCEFINIDRSVVRIEDGSGAARINGGVIADVATTGTGYVIEDNRTSPSQRHQMIGVDVDGAPNDIINDWSVMGTYLATEGNTTGSHTMLGNQEYSNTAASALEPGEIAVDDNRGGTGNFALLYHDGTNVQYWDADGTL